ncbi:low molecular weight phosphatase family protein [Microbacterium hydrocarbonoxydans]|uniref:arsenate reductase/protein-tyrosine-phosphatase family protein n=1 Tax=Microbacterium hydrocarbonoxydans TaxID=273678 RepID=UPI0013D9B944|nr:low molecular weight phosphatase family protein [Microbacterium hydrocarbonoxydans]
MHRSQDRGSLGEPGGGIGAPATPLTRRERRRSLAAQTQTPEAAPAPATRSPLSLLFDPAPAEASDEVGALSLLTVCTGNICRSPLAEVMLRVALDERSVIVASAGTHALVGHEMTAQARSLAVAGGAREYDASSHRARLLTERMLLDTDLVLTMTREHRAFAVQLAPSRLHRVFPVREFARLAASMTDDEVRRAADAGTTVRSRVRSAVTALSHRRGLAGVASADDDVIDPYRRSTEVYEQSARELFPALEQVERVVRVASS